MSYNVLADSLARAHARELYPRSAPEQIAWRRRWALVLEEVRSLSPGVLCLQEVDAALWSCEGGVLEALRGLGYDGVHARRTGDRGDGCAVLWRRGEWAAVAIGGGEQHPHPHHVLRFSERGLRDNVAVSVLLRPRGQRRRQQQQHLQQQPQAHPAAKRARSSSDGGGGSSNSSNLQPDFRLLVSTTHLLFNPKRGDTKLGQLRTLLCELHAQGEAAAAASLLSSPPPRIFPIVCGDLNAAPDSAIYSFVTRGELDCLSCDRRSLSGVVESSGPASPFRMWGAAQRRHGREREVAAAAAAAADAAGIQRPRGLMPPPLDAERLLFQGQAPLPWLRPYQHEMMQAWRASVAAAEVGGGGGVVSAALLERIGWDEQGMAQATGRGRWSESAAAAVVMVTEEDEDENEDEDEEDEDEQEEEEEDTDDFGGALSNARPAEACIARHPWPGGLKSAYATVCGKEPSATSVHAKFAGTLDYLCYHEHGIGGGGAAARLKPTRVLLPPPLRLLLPPRAPPSAGVPSDHVSVVADFEIA
jgi:mRNA deadenylase 3'-5' endonuclease subunit Ccr4